MVTTEIDEIIISNEGIITIVEKIINGSTIGYSRRSINPGDDYTAEQNRVKLIADLVHSEAYLGEPINPVNNSNWDGFNNAMLNDSDFNAIVNSAPQILVASLPAALTQVANNQLTMFESLWSILFNGNVTEPIVTKWVGFATSNNLPDNFISILANTELAV